eukprot:GFUD01018461.1.p1 GENE.GFUD01018461.1~~GFUD01018461.1.p1  ORF type:complete len:283 (+),score=37.89 GFUD01018461.1:63-911(+)
MLAARLCSTAVRGILVRPAPSVATRSALRFNSGDTKNAFSRMARRKTLKETAMAPEQGTAINMGQGALAGAAVVGLGALAFYGAGMSGEMGAVDKAVMWPQYVKERVKDTYMYFGGSLVATAGTAAAIFRSPAAMNIVSRGGLMAMEVSIAAMIGSSMVARSIPYTPGFGAKQLAWLTHCAVVGAVIAPICLLRGTQRAMELHPLTLLTPASVSTWTPSTSSSGSPSPCCWPAVATRRSKWVGGPRQKKAQGLKQIHTFKFKLNIEVLLISLNSIQCDDNYL